MNVLGTTRRPETRRGTMALAIKRRTAPAHRVAEATVARARPFASRGSYAAYLSRLYGFYAALEPQLHGRLGEILPDAGDRRKLPALEADLRVLDAPRPSSRHWCAALPRVDRAASAIGVAYVLEGKTLGGRFLLDEARRALGLDADRGARFFAGYGERTGEMWRRFRDALETWVRLHGQRSAVLAAAEATFESFTSWIGPLGWADVSASTIAPLSSR